MHILIKEAGETERKKKKNWLSGKYQELNKLSLCAR